MGPMLPLAFAVVTLTLLLAGCSGSPELANDVRCEPKSLGQCLCANGAVGAAECNAKGTLMGACACDGHGKSTLPPPVDGAPLGAATDLATLAIDKIFLGEADRDGVVRPTAWGQFGWDLDGVISTADSVLHCHPDFDLAKIDGDDGIDNSFGANLWPNLYWSIPGYVKALDDAITSGASSWVLRIVGIGSDPTLDGVDAQFFDATRSSQAGWSVRAPAAQFRGYVTNGLWVARALSLEIDLKATGFPPLRLPISSAIITGHVVGSGPETRIDDGVIAGTLSADLFAEADRSFLSGIPNWSPGACSEIGAAFVSATVGDAKDILLGGRNEHGVACDAVSIGLGFTASASDIVGSASPLQEPTDPCP